MKKVYIITGASGLVGNNLVRELLKINEKVRILLLQNEHIVNIDQNKVEIVFGNVCDIDSLEPLFKKEKDEYQICIHCAGIITISSKNDERVYNVNVNGTKNIIEMCKKHKTDKLIYVSSVHAIEELKNNEIIKETKEFDPNKLKGLYAKTKALATKEVLNSAKEGLNVTIVHPSGIIGPYDYFIGNFTELIIEFMKGKLPAIVNGGYDFVDVRDVCSGILNAVEKGVKGECYILSNQYYSVKELLDTLAKVSNKKPVKVILPRWFIKPLAPIAEIYYKIAKRKPLFTPYSLFVLKTNANFSHEKATKELNYHPRLLETTLKDTIEFLKDNKMI